MWPFAHSSQTAPPPEDEDAYRDILSEPQVDTSRTRWTRMLVLFMRGLALICLVRGLLDWARILGLLGEPDAFMEASLLWQASIAAFAVLNCITAVGLWMTSSWGAVLWLMLTVGEVVAPVIARDVARVGGMQDIAFVALIIVYVILTLKAVQERKVLR